MYSALCSKAQHSAIFLILLFAATLYFLCNIWTFILLIKWKSKHFQLNWNLLPAIYPTTWELYGLSIAPLLCYNDNFPIITPFFCISVTLCYQLKLLSFKCLSFQLEEIYIEFYAWAILCCQAYRLLSPKQKCDWSPAKVWSFWVSVFKNKINCLVFFLVFVISSQEGMFGILDFHIVVIIANKHF